MAEPIVSGPLEEVYRNNEARFEPAHVPTNEEILPAVHTQLDPGAGATAGLINTYLFFGSRSAQRNSLLDDLGNSICKCSISAGFRKDDCPI